LLEYWLDHHVDGLEVICPKHTPEYRRGAMDIVRRKGRPYTGGTDAHGYSRARTPHSEAGYECVQMLRDWKAKRA
jgi:hypothetical protein